MVFETHNDFTTEVHFFLKPIPHFIFISEISDKRALVEIGTSKKFLKHIDTHFDQLFDNSLAVAELKKRFSNAELLEKSKGGSMRLGKNPRLLSAERALLAGSAIGSIHPLTGFGVGHAMRSGQLAAYWAAQSLAANDFSASFLKQYDRNIIERMKGDFRYGALINWASRNLSLILPIVSLFIFKPWFAVLLTKKPILPKISKPSMRLKRLFSSFSSVK